MPRSLRGLGSERLDRRLRKFRAPAERFRSDLFALLLGLTEAPIRCASEATDKAK